MVMLLPARASPRGWPTCSQGQCVLSAGTESLLLLAVTLFPLHLAGSGPDRTKDAARLHAPRASPSPTALERCAASKVRQEDAAYWWSSVQEVCWESSVWAEIEEGRVNGDREEPEDTAGLGK